ncbi:RHS repeat-associated core domain-containing protein [Kitasatospora sp. NPDC004240]
MATPPAVAWTYPEPVEEVWAPPNTPLGNGTPPVKGGNAARPAAKEAAKPADWTPQVAAPVTSGTETIQIGMDSAEAKAARKATGGASPASGGATGVRAGKLAVEVAPGTGKGEAAQAVTVEVTDENKGTAVGVTGPLVALTDAGLPVGEGRTASVTLDLKGLQAGGWADRAQLVALPACALTTPQLPECRIKTPVSSTTDAKGRLTADLTLPGAKPATLGASGGSMVKASFSESAASGVVPAADTTASAPMVLAAEPTPSGGGGTYTATPLAPSAGWNVGSNAGNFTYGYPIQVPAALGGAAPTVTLGYNSAAVDGKTSATNAQSSWIGDGWGYEPGFIERSYRGCAKAGITGSGDQCWAGQNATLSLGGRSGTIVRDDATGAWRLQSDDGSKVEQLTGAPRAVGDQDYRDMEYWRITTPDGTEYYFGRNHLPGGDGTDPATNSVLTASVYSPKNGDPCYSGATGLGSWCQMAWRWQLDYVVDARGNLTTYKYATEGNKYSRGGAQNQGNGTLTDYQRAGYLREIGYGQRLDEQKAAKGALNPAAKVVFRTEERCKPSGAVTCTEDQRTTANADAWPDVPIDQICTGSGTCSRYAPTYFTTKRLTAITTQVLVGSAYRDVDTWALSQSLADPGDGTKRTLQLNSIQRTGSNGQTPITLPAVTFEYVMMANRVDGFVPAAPMFMRPRLQAITTETGGTVNVIYSNPECSRVAGRMPSSEDSNTMACIPVKWYLPGQSSPDPVNDWFNKPLVKIITEQDKVVSPAVSKVTEYTYNGGAAWHRNDAEFIDPKTRTWDNFRGYQSVTTSTGSAFPGEAPKTQQTATYLRGMDGDYLTNGTQRSVQIASPLGGTVTDSNWINGRVVATEIFDKAGGTVQSITGNTYSGQQITATRAQSAGAPKIYARYPDSQTTAISKAKLSDGSWRTVTGATVTDPAHGNRVVQSSDKGDGTAATPETCTSLSYATSTNSMLLNLASEQITVQGACGTTPTAANTVSGSRTLYDGRPFGEAGGSGQPTSTQVLDHYDSTGKAVYAHSGTTSFDLYGRVVSSATTNGSTYDAAGNQLTGATVTPAVTTVTQTPATGALPIQASSTGPLGGGWTTTMTLDPGRTNPLTTTDVNGQISTLRYDALGRLTAVWTPDRPSDQNPSQRFSYAVNGTSAPSHVMAEWIREDGATYSAEIDIIDGLGRTRQTQRTSDAKPAGRLITDSIYDSHGWAVKASAPYYEETAFPSGSIFLPVSDGQVPGQTWTSYDGLGRVIRSEFRSYGTLQWATANAYPGADRVDVTPPDGAHPTSTVTDARGRTVAGWQYRTATTTGNPADADITTYRYTASGQPAANIDSSGNTWTYTYDLRGRQTSTSDPDSGVTNTFYDANSRVDHTTDARGTTLAYSYDLLGRKTGLYKGSVTPANQLASWTYDTLAKGQRTSSTRYVGGTTGAAYTTAVTGYDTVYRPLGTSITIPAAEGALAGTYTMTSVYSDVVGTLKQLEIPAAGGLPAESVTYNHTVTGLFTGSMSQGKAVVADMEYDALARPIRTTVGRLGRQVVSTQQYDWATGRVINSFIDRQSGTVSADQTSYTYAPSGRITSVTSLQDSTARDTQCFAYDHLGRLTNAWTDTGATHTTADWTDSSGTKHGTGSSTRVAGIGGCDNVTGPAITGPGGRTVGGPAPYWNTYTYDATGNRTGLVRHDITGNTAKDITTTQAFGANRSLNTPTNAPTTGGGTGGPHALLTSTNTSESGTKAFTYQYDAKGNATAITDTAGTTTLTWNGEDKLESLTKTGQVGATTYLYDADGNQLIRRNPGTTTLNLPTDELTLDATTGSMSNVRSFQLPGGLTYNRVTAPIGGGTVLIHAADPHGTSNIQIGTDAAMTTTRRLTDPFGNPRGTQPAASAWAGTKGFVGGNRDDTTGLTSLGARQYDPNTGRFISPDPILSLADPQQWNAYAYSNNDPINLSDPSGLIVTDCKEGRCSGHHNPRGPEDLNVEDRDYDEETKPSTDPIILEGGIMIDPRTEGLGNFLKAWRDKKAEVDNRGLRGLSPTPMEYGWAATQACDNVKCGFYAQLVEKTQWIGILSGEVGGYGRNGGVPRTFSNGRWKSADVPSTSGQSGAMSSINGCHSFPPDTLVLMADGTTRPISQLEVGDEVLATDPLTGTSGTRSIYATITTPDDTAYTDLSFEAQDGIIPLLTSTSHHPYWNETTKRWVNAAEIRGGDTIATADGRGLTVATVRSYSTSPRPAYDLTITDLHTYYVLANSSPVLVHNSASPKCKTWSNREPGDKIRPVTPMPIEEVKKATGKFIYVVMPNGELRVTRLSDSAGHIDLAQGKDVIAAGEFKVFDGRLKEINNKSGHYRPTGAEPRTAAENAFRKDGWNVTDKTYKERW